MLGRCSRLRIRNRLKPVLQCSAGFANAVPRGGLYHGLRADLGVGLRPSFVIGIWAWGIVPSHDLSGIGGWYSVVSKETRLKMPAAGGEAEPAEDGDEEQHQEAELREAA